jgi:DNA or RNA helicases of superfamily II
MNLILKSILNKIPGGIMRKLIGQSICDAIINYAMCSEDEIIDYSEVLFNKYGNKILLQKNIFKNLILFLPTKTIFEIANNLNISSHNEEDTRLTIVKQGFGFHNQKKSIIILTILGLDPDFFLPNPEIEEKRIENVLTPSHSLHKYQKNIKDRAIQYLLSTEHSNRLLIHMPTGAGKTKTAMEILSDYLRSRSVLGGFDKSAFIIWLAHSKELCDQAYESFSHTWKLRGDTEINSFKLYGESKIDNNIFNVETSIIFVGFQKFNSILSSKDQETVALKKHIIDNVKLVIVDEAHKSLAATYENTINSLTERYAGVQLIGLTATPGRTASKKDVENDLLAHFYNSTKVGITDDYGIEIENPIHFLQDLGVLAEIEREELMTETQIQIAEQEFKDLKIFGDEKLKRILKDLSVNPSRNKLIIEKIKRCYERGDSILIFACSVEHCIILQSLLNYTNIESQIILGSTSKIGREENIKRFKNGDLKILINFGVLSTGFDAPNLNTLIITRPTTSLVLYSQMVGRALRGPLNGGNKKID